MQFYPPRVLDRRLQEDWARTASSLAYAAVSRSGQENLLQAPLLSRSNSMEASLAKDTSSNDVKNGQGYMVLL